MSWTRHQFFHSGDAYFAEMLRQIRVAKKKIQIETYIFEYDSLTRVLLEELKQASARGCTVQLLLDGFGSYYWQETVSEWCRKAHIDLRIFKPLPRGLMSFRRLMLVFRLRLIGWMRGMNRRNHRKVALFDDHTAILGSFNMTQVHSEKIMGQKAWRDSAVLVEGPSVRDLHWAFSVAWTQSRRGHWRRFVFPLRRQRVYDPRSSDVRLNVSTRDRLSLARELARRLKRAERRIRIETAYFLPTRWLLNALLKASRRGVQVEVILPGVSDVPLVKWAAAEITSRLIAEKVRVFEYQPSILHAKFMIIDDWAALGSLNMNHRSLIHDLEVEAVFNDSTAVSELNFQWERDRDVCRPVSIEEFRRSSRLWRWLARLAFRLRYLL